MQVMLQSGHDKIIEYIEGKINYLGAIATDMLCFILTKYNIEGSI